MNQAKKSKWMPLVMREAHRNYRAFTLIELLVVISIIALLAALVVGLSGTATLRSRESRTRADLQALSTAIDAYHADYGAYPADHLDPAGRVNTVTNLLFYELTGTYLRNDIFVPAGPGLELSTTETKKWFNTPGFCNVAPARNQVKSFFTPRASQYAQINDTTPIFLLVAPVKWVLGQDPAPIPGSTLNPWRYDGSSANRRNQQSFDLWVETVRERKTPGGTNETQVFGNW